MKYGTALKIARVALTVAIVLILVFPLVGSIASTNVKDIKPGIESTYALDIGVSDETTYKSIMTSNLGQIESGFDKMVFNDGTEYITSDVSDAVNKMFQSKGGANTSVSMYKDDKICTQKTIQYHDGLKTIVYTGMKVPDNIGGLASFDVSLSFVGTTVDYRIPYGTGNIENNYLVIKAEIPDLLNMLCNSLERNMEFKVHVSILTLANFDVDIDILTSPTVTYEYDGTNKAINFTGAAVGTPNLVTIGENNGVTYKIQTDSTVKLMSTDSTKKISDQLKSGLSSDGSMKINGGEYIISADYAKDIIKIVEYMEAHP